MIYECAVSTLCVDYTGRVIYVCFLYPFSGRASGLGDGGSGFSLDNFRDIFGYWKFNMTLTNTLLLAAAVVPVQLAMALLMATMVSRMGKGAT
ncbi:hypothetical protein [Planktomarina sp.]|uniref:hypothetical protein n=1 Tax=Planktomarina sp. TaxID=2024851 RepID=UPI0032613715